MRHGLAELRRAATVAVDPARKFAFVGTGNAYAGVTGSHVDSMLALDIGTGELSIDKFMQDEQVQEITDFFLARKTKSMQEAKLHFGEAYSYGQLKMVLKHLEYNGVSID